MLEKLSWRVIFIIVVIAVIKIHLIRAQLSVGSILFLNGKISFSWIIVLISIIVVVVLLPAILLVIALIILISTLIVVIVVIVSHLL